MGDDTIAVQKQCVIIKRASFCTGGRRNWSCWLLMEGMAQGVCVCVRVCVHACTVACTSIIYLNG